MASSGICLIAAPSSLGLSRPDGRIPRVDLLPEALLDAGLGRRLGVSVESTVAAGPYDPVRDPHVGVLNPRGIADVARRLADAVEAARRASRFALVLGGDCSILLGCLLGLRRTQAHTGLAFLDGHTDFWPPEASPRGGVAGMDLWFSTGRGHAALSDLEGHRPLVRDEDVAILVVRDPDEWTSPVPAEHARDTAMTLVDLAALRHRGVDATVDQVLANWRARRVDSAWIHLDADVMHDAEMHAVDSPQPDGLRSDELSRLLSRLVGSGLVAGLDVTIYDPSLDPTREAARVLADVLVEGLSAVGATKGHHGLTP